MFPHILQGYRGAGVRAWLRVCVRRSRLLTGTVLTIPEACGRGADSSHNAGHSICADPTSFTGHLYQALDAGQARHSMVIGMSPGEALHTCRASSTRKISSMFLPISASFTSCEAVSRLHEHCS